MVVRVTLNQPLSERNKLNWSVVLVKSKTLSTESVVFFLITVLVGGNLKVVWVSVSHVGIQVHKDGLFFAFAVEK